MDSAADGGLLDLAVSLRTDGAARDFGAVLPVRLRPAAGPVERRPADRGAGLVCGAAGARHLRIHIGARVTDCVRAVCGCIGWSGRLGSSAALLRRYMPIAAGAFVISIPNLIFFLRQPAAFLSRGSYVLDGLGRCQNYQCRMDGTVSDFTTRILTDRFWGPIITSMESARVLRIRDSIRFT